jgi:thiol-disulfide isomerase/thioredoxin
MSPSRIVLLALALVTASSLHAQADKIDAPYASDPKFVAAFNQGRQYRSEDNKEAEARDCFLKANKIAGGVCIPCLNRVYDIDLELKNFKDAVNVAGQLVALAPDPRAKSQQEGRQGDAMLRQAGDKPKPAQLEAVHAVMQAALTDHPRNQKALWDDAMVLARLGRLDDAKAEFTTYASRAQEKDPKRVRAAHFAGNPQLATQKMAPAFQIRTLDGTEFNLDEMGGKVVLIDFWATWCGPCMQSLPEIKKIAKEFAGQPLVILSISQDDDGPKWKEFVATHGMTWLQYRDRSGRLSSLFDIQGIPHYFTIDSDGVLTAEMMGSDSNVEGKLKKLVKRAAEAQAASGAGTE